MGLKVSCFVKLCPVGFGSLRVAFDVYRERVHARHIRHRWVRREKRFQRQIRTVAAAVDLADTIIQDTEDCLYPTSDEELLPSGRLLLQRMEEKQQEASASSGQQQQQQQMLDDERLAMILQNAEFVEALRSDQDFMESLATESATQQSPGSDQAADVKPLDEEAAFREKLRQMGKIPRRKLTQLARTFFRGKKISFPSMGSSSVKERPILCDQDEEWTSHADQDESQGAVQRSQKYP